MSDTTTDRQPGYYVRIGRDQKTIDRLLSAPVRLGGRPLPLEGVVFDSPHVKDSARLRESLPSDCRVFVDPQVYRMQEASSLEIAALNSLPYSPQERPYEIEDFDDLTVSSFVQSVLDFQTAARVTSYLAPAFYLPNRSSPWRDVNARLLRESIRQVGTGIFATLCGATETLRDVGLAGEISTSGAEGVYLLISPFAPLADSVSKMVDYLRLTGQLWQAGVEVVAARQPAFGLGLLALGIASFDSGIAQAEDFNYRNLVRKRAVRPDGSSGEGKPRRVYFSDLMTTVSADAAAMVLETPALRSLLSCDRFCCEYAPDRVLVRPQEHFLCRVPRRYASCGTFRSRSESGISPTRPAVPKGSAKRLRGCSLKQD